MMMCIRLPSPRSPLRRSDRPMSKRSRRRTRRRWQLLLQTKVWFNRPEQHLINSSLAVKCGLSIQVNGKRDEDIHFNYDRSHIFTRQIGDLPLPEESDEGISDDESSDDEDEEGSAAEEAAAAVARAQQRALEGRDVNPEAIVREAALEGARDNEDIGGDELVDDEDFEEMIEKDGEFGDDGAEWNEGANVRVPQYVTVFSLKSALEKCNKRKVYCRCQQVGENPMSLMLRCKEDRCYSNNWIHSECFGLEKNYNVEGRFTCKDCKERQKK